MMVIEKILIEPHKPDRDGNSKVDGIRGIALTTGESTCARKINEIIDVLNAQQ